jgi:hypothetical protein
MTAKDVSKKVSREARNAFVSGLIGDRTLEALISHEILMIIQTRQGADNSAVLDFDICAVRLEAFRMIAGRDAV